MTKNAQSLVGKKLRQHLIKNICKIMREYAPEVGVTKAELANDISAIKEWDLDCVTDWFYIYDALGSCGNLDPECRAFYAYARARWYYDNLAGA
jgi:hypothetical protein